MMRSGSAGITSGLPVTRAQSNMKAKSSQHFASPKMPNTPGKEEAIAGVEVNPTGLLPRDTSYYTYSGSLTAPPCSEGVTWFVLKTPVDISAEEISAFAKLYPHDVRPLQPLNGRVVKESE